MVASSDPSVVAFVNNDTDGTFSLVTSPATGSATVTIAAYGQDGSVLLTAQFAVTVVYPASGRDGSTVTLGDLEDNSWAYYSDPQCPVRSLNPVNVKVTYRGNGYVLDGSYADESVLASLTSLSDLGRTVAATGVRVGPAEGETEHTFVYYTTLERTDGRTAASMAAARGPAEYRTIPNPFAVRPTYGVLTDASQALAWDGWRGFFGWRVASLSGGSLCRRDGSPCTVGSILSADSLVYFSKSSSALADNSIDIELELDAVWAQAYVGTVAGDSAGDVSADHLSHLRTEADVERNFIVVMGNQVQMDRRNASTYRATWSGLFPNGTSDGVLPATEAPEGRRLINDNILMFTDFKLEYLRTEGGRGLCSNFHNLTIGRGMLTTEGRYVFGNVRGADVTPLDHRADFALRVECGRYLLVRLMNFSGDAKFAGNLFSVRGTYGSDYDRAVADNSKLVVAASMGGSATSNGANPRQVELLAYDHLVKSGTLLQGGSDAGRTTQSRCAWVLYLSKWSGDANTGRRRIVMEGGRLGGIGGGVDYDGASWDNNYVTAAGRRDSVMVDIRIKGGELTREVYGGAENSPGAGQRRLVITGGTFYSWIAAGANANEEGPQRGYVSGTTMVYFGGKAHLDTTGSALGLTGNPDGNIGLLSKDNSFALQLANSIGYNAPTGCLFGAGIGSGTPDTVGNATGKVECSVVVVADSAVVDRDVYGGGYKGFCRTGSSIYITGHCTVRGSVYGGSNSNGGGATDVLIEGGLVEGSIYGGSN